MYRCLLFPVALLSLAFAPAPAPKPDKRGEGADDLKALAGVWVLASETRQGKAAALSDRRLAFSGGAVHVTDGLRSRRWEVTVDARKDPKTLDLLDPTTL